SSERAEVEALWAPFDAFAKTCRTLLAHAACAEASALARTIGGVTYGIAAGADLPLEVITPGPDRARGALHAGAAGVLSLEVPQPGVHNLENAAAAALVALELGVPAAAIGPALARFPGVARRFQGIRATARGIRVGDG